MYEKITQDNWMMFAIKHYNNPECEGEKEFKDDLKKFIMFPFDLYKDSKYWVAPIIKEELEILDKEINPVFKHANITAAFACDPECGCTFA